MISLESLEALRAVQVCSLDPDLHPLLAARVGHNLSAGLEAMTHYLIVQAGDSEADIIREIGFSPLVNYLDGIRFGSIGFHPYWDWLQHHDGWFELIVTVGNDGFGFVLLVQDAEGVLPDLIEMCRGDWA